MKSTVDLSRLNVKPSGPVKGIIPEEFLIPDEWWALTKALLPGRKVTISIVSGPYAIDDDGTPLNGRVGWTRGNEFAIEMMLDSFIKRSLEESFKTFLHECAHLKWTTAQSSEHVGKVLMDLVDHEVVAELVTRDGVTIVDARELIANYQRDLWLKQAEEIVGKDADWTEKARALCNGRTVGT